MTIEGQFIVGWEVSGMLSPHPQLPLGTGNSREGDAVILELRGAKGRNNVAGLVRAERPYRMSPGRATEWRGIAPARDKTWQQR